MLSGSQGKVRNSVDSHLFFLHVFASRYLVVRNNLPRSERGIVPACLLAADVQVLINTDDVDLHPLGRVDHQRLHQRLGEGEEEK